MIDRSAYCDAQLPPENLKDFLPQLIPVWLKLKFFFPHSCTDFCSVWKFNFSCMYYFCRFCYPTWHMLMMMNHLLRLRSSFLFIFWFVSFNCFFTFIFLTLTFNSRRMDLFQIEIRLSSDTRWFELCCQSDFWNVSH